MTRRGKALICFVAATAALSLESTLGQPEKNWLRFLVYLIAILFSSGMKVAMPKGEGTMPVNYPLILLAILQLSPLQAVTLAISSVVAQCRFGELKPFTPVQIFFNVANVTTATVISWHVYAVSRAALHGESAPALALAATSYFLVNTVPLALILGLESHISPYRQWRQEYLWYLPFYIVGALLAALADFVGLKFGWLTSLLLIPMVYTVYRTYQAQVAMARDRERHILDTEALHLRAIEGLAMAIEAKDQNTHRHLMRVRVYVSELAKIMGLERAQMQALLTASLLHDIGKLAVPEYIINKPGKLTPEEFDKMKIHPVVGADILERVHFPYPVVPIVRSHHESWDGSGYPDGLKREEIPIGARLLTAVDCFDAMASDRPYRKALPVDEAMDFVKSRAGVQFDPEIVALLAEHYPRLEEMARQQIQEMEPLKTDLLIERGAAPGAGFAEEAVASARSSTDSSPTGTVDLPSLLTVARREAEALVAETESPSFSGGVSEIGRALCRALQPLIPFDCCALFARRGDTIYPCSIEGAGADAFSRDSIPVGDGLSGWVALSQRSILNGNPTVEPNFLPQRGLYTANSSALSVPIFDANGVLFSVLTLYSRQAACFSRQHLRILEAIQPGLATAVENAVKFEDISVSSMVRAAVAERGFPKNGAAAMSRPNPNEAVPALRGMATG